VKSAAWLFSYARANASAGIGPMLKALEMSE
jgi:hypothetical protein